MGTRADFYVGRGKKAEWLGSVAYDGCPEGIDDAVLAAADEAVYRSAVSDFLKRREDGTTPDRGWPWPWEDSHLTDYAYAFDDRGVFVTSGEYYPWLLATGDLEGQLDKGDVRVEFPDMTSVQNVTLGSRSGVLFLSSVISRA